MSAYKTAQYQAYSVATRTAPKTRQIVMLYDGVIRFLRQAQTAITAGNFEERFKLLKRAADIVTGLQSSIDFDAGGEIAQTLNHYYTNLAVRIMGVNFHRQEGGRLCDDIIDDLKQMREVWDQIDRNLNTPGAIPVSPLPLAATAAALSSSVSA
jgi:flagellar protein FliS